MGTLIASSLIDLLDLSATTDPWKLALDFLIKQQKIDPYRVESLIAPLKASTPSKEEFLTAAAFLSLNETLKYELKGDLIALCDGVDPAIRELIFTLLGHSSHTPYKVSSPSDLLYFGLAALFQNSTEKKRTFLQKVGEINQFLDRKGNPFFGLMSDEKHFCLATLLAIFFLIFSLAKEFSNKKEFETIANHLYHRLGLLEGYFLDAIPSHLLLLSLLLERCESGEKSSYPIPFARGFSRNLALWHEQLNKIDFTCQFSGVGSSFAAASKGNVEIVAMAPQKLPLGVMENFGLFRLPPNDAGEFSDLKYEEDFLEGWIKLCQYGTDHPEPGKDWIYTEVKTKPDYLTFTFTPQKPEVDYYIVFFIKAKEAKVEGRPSLKPKCLERLRGEVGEIFFKDADEVLSLRTKEPTKIEVIPLAGGNHFWSAHFLVAFPINESLSIEIS
ncbi:MAG: hypothetical protein SNF33_06890 [Candidatus Algichlamydia australiensis]|nr:hypothetical protein [Chlamydiales bacterium]